MIPKFRAWDKARNEMNYKVMVGNCDTDDENWTCPIIWIEEKKDWLHFDDYECIMQSTGLLDKNGKEIFEGDIVQFEDCYEVSDFLYINTGIIEWCQGGFHVTNRDSVLMEDLFDGDSLDVTIIGNIYENPEILKEKE
ncbi:phage protein [Streptococcus pneumoniae]|nr:phage protein [Streptococcus pneumoniae]